MNTNLPPRIPRRESNTVEFKTSFGSAVIESLCALANAQGGSVFVGVNDSGEPVGVDLAKDSILNWLNEIRTKTTPAIIPDVVQFQKKRKDIVVFSIKEFPIKPVAVSGRYLIRREASNIQMSVSEVVLTHLRTFNSSWDYYTDSEHKLDDISLEKVGKSIEVIARRQGKEQDAPLDFLRKQELIRDGKISNAGYLLFTENDTAMTTIELGRFQSSTIIKDSARTKSDIISQVEQVLDYIKKHINKKIVLTGAAENEQRWQYPLEALREIVLNMIVHRDYRAAADSIIKIFDNRIEFYNPGSLPSNITIPDLLSDNYVSSPRNKKIADFFKDLGLIEKYGSGIQRVLRQFQQEGLPSPLIETIADGIRITVFGNTESKGEKPETKGEKPETKGEKPETKGEIIKAMQGNNQITVEELACLLSLSIGGIEWNIRQLKKAGILTRIGSNKGGHWKILK